MAFQLSLFDEDADSKAAFDYYADLYRVGRSCTWPSCACGYYGYAICGAPLQGCHLPATLADTEAT